MAEQQDVIQTIWIRDAATELGGVAEATVTENIDRHAYTCELLVQDAANFDLVARGEWLRVRHVAGATVLQNDLYIDVVEESFQQAGDGTQVRVRRVRASSQVREALDPIIRREWPREGVATATEIVVDAWTEYGPGGIDLATEVEASADRLHVTAVGWSLKQLMDEICMRTGYVWWVEADVLYFVDPAGAAVAVASENVRDGTFIPMTDEEARVFAVEVRTRAIEIESGEGGGVSSWAERFKIIRRARARRHRGGPCGSSGPRIRARRRRSRSRRATSIGAPMRPRRSGSSTSARRSPCSAATWTSRLADPRRPLW